MSVTRINEFRARAGSEQELTERFRSTIVPLVRGIDGCISCELLVGHDDPSRLLVVEVWKSIDVHRAAAAQIPRDMLDQTMQLLEGPPSGAYYESVRA